MAYDYSLVYAKITRHVAVADALLASNRVFEASEELQAAMSAIAAFENVTHGINSANPAAPYPQKPPFPSPRTIQEDFATKAND